MGIVHGFSAGPQTQGVRPQPGQPAPYLARTALPHEPHERALDAAAFVLGAEGGTDQFLEFGERQRHVEVLRAYACFSRASTVLAAYTVSATLTSTSIGVPAGTCT